MDDTQKEPMERKIVMEHPTMSFSIDGATTFINAEWSNETGMTMAFELVDQVWELHLFCYDNINLPDKERKTVFESVVVDRVHGEWMASVKVRMIDVPIGKGA